jgi:sulfur relay (sulfurtransferase) DsrC/TusE family protein
MAKKYIRTIADATQYLQNTGEEWLRQQFKSMVPKKSMPKITYKKDGEILATYDYRSNTFTVDTNHLARVLSETYRYTTSERHAIFVMLVREYFGFVNVSLEIRDLSQPKHNWWGGSNISSGNKYNQV